MTREDCTPSMFTPVKRKFCLRSLIPLPPLFLLLLILLFITLQCCSVHSSLEASKDEHQKQTIQIESSNAPFNPSQRLQQTESESTNSHSTFSSSSTSSTSTSNTNTSPSTNSAGLKASLVPDANDTLVNIKAPFSTHESEEESSSSRNNNGENNNNNNNNKKKKKKKKKKKNLMEKQEQHQQTGNNIQDKDKNCNQVHHTQQNDNKADDNRSENACNQNDLKSHQNSDTIMNHDHSNGIQQNKEQEKNDKKVEGDHHHKEEGGKEEEEEEEEEEEDDDDEDEEDDSKHFVEIQVSRVLLHKYELKPMVISHNQIKFMNAQVMSYYERELKNPALTVWMLFSGTEPGKNNSYSYTIKRLYETAYDMNIQMKMVDISKFDLVINEDGLTNIVYDGVKVKTLPDAILPRLAAKITYFGLAVVRQLEKMGVLVINEFNSLEISKDKLYTLQQLGAHNIPIPKTMIVKLPVNYTYVREEFGYPFVLKRSSGSQGRGVMLVQDVDHLKDLVDMMDTTKSYILQEFISKSSGRDIRVIVIGGKAIGAMMRVARKGFRSNFHQGGYTKPVRLNHALEWLAIKAASLIGLDIAGVDILIDKDTYRICEINSTPGFQGFELATGIDVAQRIMEYVKFRAGVWQNTRVTQKRQVVTVPVLAEHLTPPPPSTQPTTQSQSTSQSPSTPQSPPTSQSPSTPSTPSV